MNTVSLQFKKKKKSHKSNERWVAYHDIPLDSKNLTEVVKDKSQIATSLSIVKI